MPRNHEDEERARSDALRSWAKVLPHKFIRDDAYPDSCWWCERTEAEHGPPSTAAAECKNAQGGDTPQASNQRVRLNWLPALPTARRPLLPAPATRPRL